MEEMEAYLASHQKVISSITFYPKFSVYDEVGFYKVGTAEYSIWDYKYTPAKRFARNPDAVDYWYDMEDLDRVIVMLSSGEYNNSEVETAVRDLSFVPQEKIDLWLSIIAASEDLTAVSSMDTYFWTMAESLKQLDPSSENQKKYDMIIEAKDKNALALFVDYCDYSGFDTKIETIRLLKEYMAKPDETWKEEILNEVIQELNK